MASSPDGGPQIGSPAPDFTLPSSTGDAVSLADLAGRPTVLVFYPADWSPVCGDQLSVLQDAHAQIAARDARVVAISVDGFWSHRAYAEHRDLHFPLLSALDALGDVEG